MKYLPMIFIFLFLATAPSWAGDKYFRKTQKVNFDGSSIDGQVRTPDGAFLNQKRGVKFIPLYNVKKQFDRGIRSSVEYLR